MGIASRLVYGEEVPGRGSCAELNALCMLSPDEGWAVGCAPSTAGERDQDGDDAVVEALFLHYVDATWSRLRTDVRGRLTSIAMTSGDDGWAVGEEGVIAHYNGTTWAQFGGIGSRGLQPTIRMLSPAEGWIARDGLGGTEKLPFLHYDGQRWTAADWPTGLEGNSEGFGPSVHLVDLTLPSRAEGWAVGTLAHVRRAEEPHRLNDGIILRFDGSRWTVDAIIEACPLSSIAMVAGGPGWAAGRRDSGEELPGNLGRLIRSKALLLRHDGGTWAEEEFPLGPSSGQPASTLWGLSMRSADDGWLVAGAAGRVPEQTEPTLLHFDGQRWTPVVLPRIADVRMYSIRQLWMTSADEGWAVGLSISTREEGRAFPQGGYSPTVLPVLLRYQQGAWSVVAS